MMPGSARDCGRCPAWLLPPAPAPPHQGRRQDTRQAHVADDAPLHVGGRRTNRNAHLLEDDGGGDAHRHVHRPNRHRDHKGNEEQQRQHAQRQRQSQGKRGSNIQCSLQNPRQGHRWRLTKSASLTIPARKRNLHAPGLHIVSVGAALVAALLSAVPTVTGQPRGLPLHPQPRWYGTFLFGPQPRRGGPRGRPPLCRVHRYRATTRVAPTPVASWYGDLPFWLTPP